MLSILKKITGIFTPKAHKPLSENINNGFITVSKNGDMSLNTKKMNRSNLINGYIARLSKIFYAKAKPAVVCHYNDNRYPESFVDYKMSQGEMLYDRREEMIHMSPRDILVNFLRDIDSQRTHAKNVVVIIEKEGEDYDQGSCTFNVLHTGSVANARGLMIIAASR